MSRLQRRLIFYLAIIFLLTAMVGWSAVVVGLLVPGDTDEGWASALAEVSSAASLALFGTLLGIKEAGLHRPVPALDVMVIPYRSDGTGDGVARYDLEVRVIVSIPPGEPPITVRTLKGQVEPLYDEPHLLSAPVLLKPDPAPLDVSVHQFSYRSPLIPRPPEGKHLRLKLFLVTDDGLTTKVVKLGHSGGYYVPAWREARRDDRWLRDQERRRRRTLIQFEESIT